MAQVFGEVPLAQVVERLAEKVPSEMELRDHVVLLDPEGFDRARPELHRHRRPEDGGHVQTVHLEHNLPPRFFVMVKWGLGFSVCLQVICREDTAPRMVYLVRRADLRRRP